MPDQASQTVNSKTHVRWAPVQEVPATMG